MFRTKLWYGSQTDRTPETFGFPRFQFPAGAWNPRVSELQQTIMLHESQDFILCDLVVPGSAVADDHMLLLTLMIQH